MPARPTMSVGELAMRSRISVRTIRYYQSEGLLPPPERSGRAARYHGEHLDRLALIAELQGRGLRLSAIAELLRHGEHVSPEGWAGLGAALSRPWSEDRPQLMSRAELTERLVDAPSGALEEFERAGLVEFRPDTTPAVYLVPSPEMLDIALALARLGVDLRTGARLRSLLHERLRDLTTELVARFTEEVSVEHLADGGPDALARLLDALQPLTRRAVDVLFAHEMERAQQQLLRAAVAEPGAGPSPAARAVADPPSRRQRRGPRTEDV
jgi:DNA-binding transcriptional MerR regulator